MLVYVLPHYMQSEIINRVYFDAAAATPMRQNICEVSETLPGNPGSLHADGRRAHNSIESARESVRGLLHGDTYQVLFVRGGTESCNLAIIGVVQKFCDDNPGEIPCVVTTCIEHSAVYETIQGLEQRGLITVLFLSVDGYGRVRSSDLRDALEQNPNIVLVSVQMVNNETGMIQPVKELSRVVRDYTKKTQKTYPYLHTDAIQAGYTIPIHLESLGADLVSLAGSKMYGPAGSAILCVRRGVRLNAMMFGGNQEYGLRSGTPVVSDCVGFAESLRLATIERTEIVLHFKMLREQLISGVYAVDSDIILNTPIGDSSPHIVHFSIPGYDSEYVVLFFDAHGISVSSQSACSARNGGVSRIIRTLWVDKGINPEQYAHIRVSFLRNTTPEQISMFLTVLAKLHTQEKQKID